MMSIHLPVGYDTLGNAFGDEVAKRTRPHSSSLICIADESTLHENCWISRGVSQNIKAGVFDLPVDQACALVKVSLNVSRVLIAVGMVIEAFDACSSTAALIVVYADKDGIAISIASGGPVFEWDKDIRGACHDHLESCFF